MTDFIQSPLNKQRKDKFLMVINTPKGLKNDLSISPNSFSMSIYGNITPDVNVPAVETRYSGQTLNVSSHTRTPYPPQVVNFTIDNRFLNYWFIYSWLNILNDDKQSIFDANNITGLTKMTEKALQDYSTNISIFALDEYEKRVIEFKYTNSFPTKLGGITWNERDPSEAEVTMEFVYSQFIAVPVEVINIL